MKFDQTFENIINKDLKMGNIPMLIGEPGIGKSSYIEAIAVKHHTKCFTLPCNQLADKADLTGARLVPVYAEEKDDNGNPTGEQKIVDYEQVFYPHAVIRRAIEYANQHPTEEPILFMDELNRTTPDVTSECLSIPTQRRIGNACLPKNLRIITAGNDKGNVTSLDTASVSRFVLYHVTPDLNTFFNVNPDLNPFIKNVLTAHPEVLLCNKLFVSNAQAAKQDDDDEDEVDINELLDEASDMKQITNPRTITYTSNWLNQFDNTELQSMLCEIQTIDGEEISILEEALNGHSGKTNFTKLLVAEIANNINTTNNQANAINVSKPAVYDQMKNCPTVTDVITFIDNMSENDKSGCLVYALYEKEDNTRIINALAPKIQNIQPMDTKALMTLVTNDLLDEGNKHVFLQSNTPIASTLAIILDQ